MAERTEEQVELSRRLRKKRSNETVNPNIKSEYRAGKKLFRLERWPDPKDPEGPDNVVLRFYPALAKFNLVSWTEAELVGLRQFLNDAIDQAIPLAAELDARAHEAAKNGDTRQRRIWIPDPQRIDY